jgi:hypothetical protein
MLQEKRSMAKIQREAHPKIHMDDFHPKNDGFVDSYQATWQESGVIAAIWLDVVDRDNWKPGRYLPRAYELNASRQTISGRPLGSNQEEIARLLVRDLRAKMLDAMTDAGWRQVDENRWGEPIFQYRPAPRLSLASKAQNDAPAPALDPNVIQLNQMQPLTPNSPEAAAGPEISERDLPDSDLVGAGAEVAGEDQARQVEPERGNAPVITIDCDLSEPPMTRERKLQHLDPLWYHAKAVQGDVQARISIRPYQDYHYPGGYILDEWIDRVDEFAWGHMGKKQEARARALLNLLREQVHAALLAGGWEKRWTNVHGKDLWLYVGTTNQPAAGPDVSEQDLPDIALAGVGAEVAGGDQVREGELAVPDQENPLEFDRGEQPEPEPRRSHVVEVVGNDGAKERGQQAAYSREVFTRPVTFTCIVCQETVTQQRYPGHTPLYCSEGCREERMAAKTRERVAKHREKKKAEAEAAASNKLSQGGVTSS